MLPLYLHIKDFMLHGESDIDFTKLTLASIIIGMRDNNLASSIGVGKTTIFHAIRYAIYNARPASNINKIIRDGAKRAEVTFDFQMSDGTIYRIERSRTKTTQNVYLKVKDGDDWNDITDRTNSLTDEKILSIIKVNQETFENSSYFKQKDQFNLASATATKRKEIIREMLHLDEWAKYEKKAKAIRDDYNNKLSLTNRSIENLGDPNSDIANLSLQLTTLDADIKTKTTDVENASKKLDDKKQELEELKRNLDSEYPQLLKKLTNEQNYLSQLNSSCKKLMSDKNNYISQIKSFSDKEISINKDLKIKQNLLEEYKTSLPESPSNEEYEKICDSVIRITTTMKENEALYKTVSKPLPSDSFCPACSTKLDDEHRKELLKAKKERLDAITAEIKTGKEKFKELDSKKKDFETKIRNYKELQVNISSLSDDIVSKTKQLKSNSEMIQQKTDLLKSLEQEIVSKEEAIEQTKTSVNSLSETIKAVESNFNDEIINKTNQEIKVLTTKQKTIRDELNSLILKKGRVESSIETRQRDLDKLKELSVEKNDFEYKYNVYKASAVVFGSSGIPALIIHSVLDSLQLETNKVLDMLVPEIQVNFFVEKERTDGSQDETLGMKFFKNGKEHDFTDLSGGQQEAVALALKFAICVINRNRCGADIKMLLLDEVEQGLDKTTIDAFYNVLKAWSNDMRIFVITHNEQLKEKFKSFILVNNDNGVSHAEVIN